MDYHKVYGPIHREIYGEIYNDLYGDLYDIYNSNTETCCSDGCEEIESNEGSKLNGSKSETESIESSETMGSTTPAEPIESSETMGSMTPAEPIESSETMGSMTPAESIEMSETVGSISTYGSSKSCCICMDKDISVTTLPCQHNILCVDCAFIIKTPCPLCRTPIEKMMIKKDSIGGQVTITIEDELLKPQSSSSLCNYCRRIVSKYFLPVASCFMIFAFGVFILLLIIP